MGDLFSADIKNPTAVRVFDRLSGAEGIRADAKSRQNIANFNAKVAENEATAKRSAAKFAGKRQSQASARTQGALETRIAARGGGSSQAGTELLAEQATESELENLLLGFEGETLATKSDNQAALDRVSGKVAKRRGDNQATAANVKFGTTLLSGFA